MTLLDESVMGAVCMHVAAQGAGSAKKKAVTFCNCFCAIFTVTA
jgi:hypothetical protein